MRRAAARAAGTVTARAPWTASSSPSPLLLPPGRLAVPEAAGGAAVATRGYALSRYRDQDRLARRLPRRRSTGNTPGPARPQEVSLAQAGPSGRAPTAAAGTAPPPRNTSFLSSIDTYVPDGSVAEETNLAPPPVAKGDLLGLDHGAATILSQPSLVVCRQLEMMNVFLGFEQANRYRLVNAKGEDVGFLAEQEGGFGTSIGRQLMRGHRPFNCVIMNTSGEVVLRVNRPFSFINSKISIYRGDEAPADRNKIGECQQIWHPYRRKYALFHRYRPEDASTHPSENTSTRALAVQKDAPSDEGYTQFANIDSRLLAWDFFLQGEQGEILGSVNRNFSGFGRELFTDTGQYVLRFDKGVAQQEVDERIDKGVGINDELKKVAEESPNAAKETALVPSASGNGAGLTLDQRAILLATAVTIDIDYFSRHSGGGLHMPMLWMPLPGMGGGGSGAEVPPAEGSIPPSGENLPEGGGGGGGYDGPVASPEYGDSPGAELPSAGGFDMDGTGGGWGDGEVMQDPWSGQSQQTDGEGGGGLFGGLFGGGGGGGDTGGDFDW